jgi:hypothetical protein
MARVTAVLARAPDQPEGDPRDRLELHVPLSSQAQLDRGVFGEGSTPWRLVRDIPGRASRMGELVPRESGWGVRRIGEDDDPIWRLEARTFRPGEHLMLTSPRGEELVFLIVNVEAV